MENNQILIKAIEKAHNNCAFKILGWESFELLSKSKGWEIDEKEEVFPIIFSHEFAKAFWGEEYPEQYTVDIRDDRTGDCIYGYISAWQLHLQEMVLEPEPLKYLEKFLEE